jgi:hypothetical protein
MDQSRDSEDHAGPLLGTPGFPVYHTELHTVVFELLAEAHARRSKAEKKACALSRGDMEAILAAMKQSEHNIQLHTTSCNLLGYGWEPCTEHDIRAVAEAMMSSMKTHDDDGHDFEVLHLHALISLTELCKLKEGVGCPALLNTSTLEAAVRAQSMYPQHFGIQMVACELISNMISHAKPEKHGTIWNKKGVIAALFASMNAIICGDSTGRTRYKDRNKESMLEVSCQAICKMYANTEETEACDQKGVAVLPLIVEKYMRNVKFCIKPWQHLQ